MKIKHIKFTLLILCIVFFAGFNLLSFAASNDSSQKAMVLDSDSDGLSDSEEALYGTDPRNPDTDRDGYSDGVEVKSGYNPLKAAPGDKIVTANSGPDAQKITTSETSLTDSFSADFQAFINSKNGQNISTTDVKSFIDTSLTDKLSVTDINDVITIDRSQLKIKNQQYSLLSTEDKKRKIQEDAAQYINQVTYLLISNAPISIVTTEDLDTFQNDFMNRLADFSSPENTKYFSDLGNRLELFLQQYNTLEVPETMIDLHLKFARLIGATSFLKNLPASDNTTDPLGKMLILTKIKDLTGLLNVFFANDFQDYLKQIN